MILDKIKQQARSLVEQMEESLILARSIEQLAHIGSPEVFDKTKKIGKHQIEIGHKLDTLDIMIGALEEAVPN